MLSFSDAFAKVSSNFAPLDCRDASLGLERCALLQNRVDTIGPRFVINVAEKRRRIQDVDGHLQALPALFSQLAFTLNAAVFEQHIGPRGQPRCNSLHFIDETQFCL